jgi:23S rRNA pseudouridine2605 synthase
MSEKLQKVLARAGLGSRRQLEEWIQAGRVSVNGVIARLGDRIEADARVQVDGKPVPSQRLTRRRVRVLIYHKPDGEVCTRDDPEGRPTVFERLPSLRSGRWIAVGRLDASTTGLLLMTTDGELANRLMHPSAEVEREYAVRVFGTPEPAVFDQLLAGVALEDGRASFDQIRDAGGQGVNHWYHVTLKEGRKREVRRLWEAVGLRVSRLIRIRYGPVRLPPRLPLGRWQELDEGQVNELLRLVRLDNPDTARRAAGGRVGGATPTAGGRTPRHRRPPRP